MLAPLSVSLVALFTQYAYAQVVRFAKTYGGISPEWAHSVQQTSDGGYIVAGRIMSFGAGVYDFFLIKTDANGNVQWAKTYGGTSKDIAHSVRQTSDGGYIVAGYTISFGAGERDLFLIKTDANGNLQWAKTYGGIYWDEARSVQQTSDGGYIVAGYKRPPEAQWNGEFILIKTDANGDVIWAKTYGGLGWDEAYSVQQTSDGGYIMAGLTAAFTVGYDFLLIKTDENGDLEWAKTYGVAHYDWAFSVQQTSDGGYIVAGQTNSFGAGSSDIFLIKTDADGNISSSCDIVRNANPTETEPLVTVNTPSPTVTDHTSTLTVTTVTSPPLTITSPDLSINAPCPLSDDNELGISESCKPVSGIITPYKGGIKVRGSGEFEVKVYNVSGVMVKSVKGKDEVKLELLRGVYFVEVVSGGKVLREKVVIR
jgi:regulation of enolase protein 1 (concanavalin A-like superfamily)